jgi:hypothetical protein
MITQFSDKKRLIARLATIAAFCCVTALSGCDCGGATGPDNKEGDAIDQALVNAPNYAWVDTYAPGWRDGFILSADGTVAHIHDSTGVAVTVASGRWSVSGTTLTTTSATPGAGYYVGSAAYSLSGDTLTFGGEKLVRRDKASITGLSKAGAGVKPVKKFRPNW